MSGGAEKKAARAAAKARKKYSAIITGVNSLYFLGRVIPGFVLSSVNACTQFGILRWLVCIAMQVRLPP